MDLCDTFVTFLLCLCFRPDLVDWKKVERRQVRERIDLAFHIMEKEYGVTRLLDPEGKLYNCYNNHLHWGPGIRTSTVTGNPLA